MRLLFAVLEDAIEPLVAPQAGRARSADALAWVLSRERRVLFAFENVCAALDIDAERMRRGLLDEIGRSSEADCLTRPRRLASCGRAVRVRNPWRSLRSGWHRACSGKRSKS